MPTFHLKSRCTVLVHGGALPLRTLFLTLAPQSTQAAIGRGASGEKDMSEVTTAHLYKRRCGLRARTRRGRSGCGGLQLALGVQPALCPPPWSLRGNEAEAATFRQQPTDAGGQLALRCQCLGHLLPMATHLSRLAPLRCHRPRVVLRLLAVAWRLPGARCNSSWLSQPGWGKATAFQAAHGTGCKTSNPRESKEHRSGTRPSRWLRSAADGRANRAAGGSRPPAGSSR